MPLFGTCGINCDTCKFKLDGACAGCAAIKGHPHWGECEWYHCAHEKGIDYCCCCAAFPCKELVEAVTGEGAPEAIDNLRALHLSH